MAEFEDVTSFLQSQSSRALNDAINTRNMIWNQIPGQVKERRLSFNVSKPALGAAPKLSDIFGVGDSTNAEVMRLNAEADEWLSKFCPAISGDLKTLPEDMLLGIISGSKPYGQDRTVLEIVWHQARDRAYRATDSEVRTIETRFAGAGFSMPQGAMVAATTAAEQRAGQAIAEVNWQQAIKDADIKVDLLKFAEEQAIRLKLGLLSQMAEFYRMWYAVPDRDLERARLRAQAQATFQSALANYHNVELAWEGMRLDVEKSKMDVGLTYDRNKVALSNGSNTAGALGQATNALAQVAASNGAAASSLVAKVEDV